jgi:hypothetical protein
VNHLLHPEADEEFAGAVRYYSGISPELGVRFYREMERLLREACADPERFRKFDAPARRHFSRDFPCAIISFHGKTGTRLDCGRDAHETASGLLARAAGLISNFTARAVHQRSSG